MHSIESIDFSRLSRILGFVTHQELYELLDLTPESTQAEILESLHVYQDSRFLNISQYLAQDARQYDYRQYIAIEAYLVQSTIPQ